MSGPIRNRPSGDDSSPAAGRGGARARRAVHRSGSRPASGTRHASRVRPGEIPPAQTIPIAVKYAVVTALLLVFFLIFLASSDLRIAVKIADERINRNGIQLAVMFAEEIEPFWARSDRTEAEKANGQAQLREMLKARIKAPALAEDVLDVVVLGVELAAGAEVGDTRYIARAGAGREIHLDGKKPVLTEAASRSGVEIHTGFLSLGGSTRRVRFFERPMTFEGRVVGTVQVYLSAAAIDSLGKALQQSVILNGLIALGIGIPLVLFAGTILTRPVRELKRDMETVAQGDLDHQSAVRSHDELGKLAAAFNRMTHQLSEAQDAEIRRQALERELSIATRIQSALLPENLPDVSGYELAAFYASAKEVGGDYYDFIPLEEGRYGIVVADVSGKGIPGSLVMTMTRSLVRMAASIHNRVSELLSQVNASLSRDMTRGMFVTMVYLNFDPATGRIQLGRAGHNPVYVYQASKAAIGQVKPNGIALGMDQGPIFDQSLQVGEVSLEPGDFMVLYTDGVTEAMNHEAEEYTPERFVEVLESVTDGSAEQIVDAVVEDLRAHAAGADQSDDLTLLVLKRLELPDRTG